MALVAFVVLVGPASVLAGSGVTAGSMASWLTPHQRNSALATIPELAPLAEQNGATPNPLSYDALLYDGLDPTALSLHWNKSTDFWWGNYTIWYSDSSSNGPWTQVWSSTNQADTSTGFYGLQPGGTTYWVLKDYDTYSGITASNTLQVNVPLNSTLSLSTPTETSAQLTWTNSASYGGLLSFGSYVVKESVNGGPFSSVSTITTRSTTSYLVNGLSSATPYAFQVLTLNNWSSDPGTLSNRVTLTTPGTLSASVVASRASADVGQPISFTCDASGGSSPFTYSWDFGDGATGSGQTASHSYQAAGSHSASCKVVDSFGASATSGSLVDILADPAVTTPSSSVVSADAGQSATFTTTASGGAGGFSYDWIGLPSVGCSGQNGPSVTCSSMSPGNLSVSIRVTDSNGFNVSSASLSFEVFNFLSVHLVASPTNLAQGDSLALVATTSGGSGGLSFTWRGLPGGCTGSSAGSVTCDPSQSGTFNINVTATDSNGGSSSTQTSVTVSAPTTALGLPASQSYLLIAGVVGVVVIAVALVALMMRRKRTARPPG